MKLTSMVDQLTSFDVSSNCTDKVAVAWRGTLVPAGAVAVPRKLTAATRIGNSWASLVVRNLQITLRTGRVSSSIPRGTTTAFVIVDSRPPAMKQAMELAGNGRR